MLTVHYTLRGRERNRDRQRRGRAGPCRRVSVMFCFSLPTVPPYFSELLMFVISSITLEDSDRKRE